MLHYILYMRVIIQCVKYKSTLILTTLCILFSYGALCSAKYQALWTCAVHISDITLLYYTHRAEPEVAVVGITTAAVEVEWACVAIKIAAPTSEERERRVHKARARRMPRACAISWSTSFCCSISKYFI